MADAVRCKKAVWTDSAWRSAQCSRKAVRDGYCNQHHPETVAKRQAEAYARDRAEMERQHEARQRPIREAVAARDAAWREAVEQVREVPREFSGTAFDSGYNAALDALLAAMEGK